MRPAAFRGSAEASLRIPDASKEYHKTKVPAITIENSREEIIDSINNLAGESELCTLALYAYRQMDKIDWLPFIKASFERNPVCFLDLNGKSVPEVYSIIENLDNQSIYDGNRLALPDEVWNYQRGDGIEKAILMADFILKKEGSFPVIIKIDHECPGDTGRICGVVASRGIDQKRADQSE